MSIFRKNLSSADRKAIDDYTAIVRSLDAKDAEIARLTAENKALTEEVRHHRIALDWLSILIKKG